MDKSKLKKCRVIEHGFECGNYENSPEEALFCLHSDYSGNGLCEHEEGFRPHLMPPSVRDYYKNVQLVKDAEKILKSGEWSLNGSYKWIDKKENEKERTFSGTIIECPLVEEAGRFCEYYKDGICGNELGYCIDRNFEDNDDEST